MYSTSTTLINKENLKHKFCFTCQVKYSFFVEDLQTDSDKDVESGKSVYVGLTFQEETHFKKFDIKLKNSRI